MNWIQSAETFSRRFPPDRRYLAAVSGGRDSIALLHWLSAHGYKKLVVCHFNHQLRGAASDRDQKFVEQVAAEQRLDMEVGSADVRALARNRKMSVEAAARDARYRFFAHAAKQTGVNTIFLAHHADDLIETFLINLFRGSGTSGLSAMREVSKRRVDHVDLTVVRPFVAIRRTQIDDYVRKHRLKFREDQSNRDLALLRNRIRRQIIPYLERNVGRAIRRSIWRAAMIAAEEESWIETQLPEPAGADLTVSELRKLPVALQRREILRWLRAKNVANVGFDVVEEIRCLLDPDSRTAKLNLPQDRHVRRRAGKIFVE
jgi:tRNA(Ile)-lysidine synthase